MPSPGDYLKIHNKSDSPISMTWDGRTTTVKANSLGLASFEHVIHHFGDPVSGTLDSAKITDEFGNVRYAPSRDNERRRLQMKHGWALGIKDPLLTENPVPDVEIYDQDDNRIWTVAEDPTGEHQLVPPNPASISQDDQIARLQRQIDLLKKQASGQSPDLSIPGVPSPTSNSPLSLDDGEDVPTDE